MKCPSCKGKAGCIDSRWRPGLSSTSRRYKCKSAACGIRFSTQEEVVEYELGRPKKVEREPDLMAEARAFARRIP